MKLFDLIKKDLLIVLRDFKALVFIFIMPIVLIVILSLALGGVFNSGFSIGRINIAVVDEDDSGTPNQQTQANGASYDTSQMSIYTVLDSKDVSSFLSYRKTDAENAEALLEDGSIDAVVTIPKGYIESVTNGMMGGGGSVEIIVEGSSKRTLQGQIAAGIVRSYTNTISSVSADLGVLIDTVMKNGRLTAETFKSIDMQGYIQKAVEASVAQAAEISLKGIEARKPLTSFMYYSIAITCMFVLYSAGQGSSFLYTEWEEKTLHRLSAAGVPKKKLLLGKSAAVFLLCILQLIVLFAFSTLAFGIDWGNWVSFVLISVCVAISVTGLGVLLMVLVYRAGNPRLGSVFQSVIVQVLALFGGSYLPLSLLPRFFSTLSLATPNGLAIQAYTGSVTGAPLTEVLPHMLGSLGLGAALYFLGVALFPRERRA